VYIDKFQERMKSFTQNINEVIGDYMKPVTNSPDLDASKIGTNNINIHDLMFDSNDGDDQIIEHQELDDFGNPYFRPNIEDYMENDSPTVISDDENIGRRVPLPHPSGELIEAIVKKCKINANGSLVDTRNTNPLLDTRKYEEEFADGTTAKYNTNIIVKNMYSQMDEEGHTYAMLSGIVDHKSDKDATPTLQGWYVYPAVPKRRLSLPKAGGYLSNGKMEPHLEHL